MCGPNCGTWNPRDIRQAGAYVDCHVAAAQTLYRHLTQQLQVPTPDLLNSLDAIEFHLQEVLWPTVAMINLHPEEGFRAFARAANERARNLYNRLLVDPRVFKLLRGANNVGLDAADQHCLHRWRESCERQGALLPATARAGLMALRQNIQRLEHEFERNLAEDKDEVQLPTTSLTGVPPALLANMTIPGTNSVRITDREVDVILTYAALPQTRRIALQLRENRCKRNVEAVEKLLSARRALAQQLGFRDFASLATRATMQESLSNANSLFEVVRTGTAEAYGRYLKLLVSAKRDDVGNDVLEPEDLTYYKASIRRALIANCGEDLSASDIGPAALSFAAWLFGVRLERRDSVDRWDPTVVVYDVLENNEVLGRLYLDLQPRSGKPPTPFAYGYHPGASGRRLPEVAVSAQLPIHGEAVGYGHMRSFLHELGHAFHMIFAGHQQRVGLMLPEQDFMEAPALLLERFAVDERTFSRLFGEQQPGCIASKTQSLTFDEVYQLRHTLVLSAYALALHDGKSEAVTDLWAQTARKYNWLTLPGERCAACIVPQFGMDDYAATYFVYLQTALIARQFYGRMAGADLPAEGTRFRRIVLAAGGSAPAAKLVERFLAP